MFLPTYNVETGWSYQYIMYMPGCVAHSCPRHSTLALCWLRNLNFGTKPFMLGTLPYISQVQSTTLKWYSPTMKSLLQGVERKMTLRQYGIPPRIMHNSLKGKIQSRFWKVLHQYSDQVACQSSQFSTLTIIYTMRNFLSGCHWVNTITSYSYLIGTFRMSWIWFQ